jgi:3-dehydroquinate dehydratase
MLGPGTWRTVGQARVPINPAGDTLSIASTRALLASELPVNQMPFAPSHRRANVRQPPSVSSVMVGMTCGLGVPGFSLAPTATAKLTGKPG